MRDRYEWLTGAPEGLVRLARPVLGVLYTWSEVLYFAAEAAADEDNREFYLRTERNLLAGLPGFAGCDLDGRLAAVEDQLVFLCDPAGGFDGKRWTSIVDGPAVFPSKTHFACSAAKCVLRHAVFHSFADEGPPEFVEDEDAWSAEEDIRRELGFSIDRRAAAVLELAVRHEIAMVSREWRRLPDRDVGARNSGDGPADPVTIKELAEVLRRQYGGRGLATKTLRGWIAQERIPPLDSVSVGRTKARRYDYGRLRPMIETRIGETLPPTFATLQSRSHR